MAPGSRSVQRSNSYLNMLNSHFNDQCGSNYDTCPPISLYQKHKLFKFKDANSLSTLSSLASVLPSEWKKPRYGLIKHHVDDKQLYLWQEPSGCYYKMIMQRSLPIFEVLPPLPTDIFKFSSKKTVSKQSFTKLLKCINKKCKPSDSDLIFGDSQTLCAKCGWESSRIDWLYEIEGQIQVKKDKCRLLQFESDDEFHDICCFPFILKPRTFYQYTGIESNA